MGSFCKNSVSLSGILSVVCISSTHICFYCTCQDPLEVWAAQDILWSLSGAHSFCLLDWVLPFSVTSSNRGLEPHLLCFHEEAVTSGSNQQIFPNFHCWLCWHQLWRGVEIRSLLIMWCHLLNKCWFQRQWQFKDFQHLVVQQSEKFPNPKLGIFVTLREILQRHWLLEDICIFCIMLFFREIGGQDWGISDLNSNLWIINLGSWSKEHQEPPPEDSIGLGKRRPGRKAFLSQFQSFFLTIGSFQEGQNSCGIALAE